MNNDSKNPYGHNDDQKPASYVYLYSELPRTCPSCDYQFSTINFRRMYPRKFRAVTLLFFMFVIFVGLVVGFFNSLLAVAIMFSLGGWGTTWKKKVAMRCKKCNWSKTFIVSVRGYRE